jgi:hypothetical protein
MSDAGGDAPGTPQQRSASEAAEGVIAFTSDDDPRLVKAITRVRSMSNPRLKEQCVRTEWATTETELERDLLVDVVSDPTFWIDVKQMATADVEALPTDDAESSIDDRLTQMFKTFDKDNSGTIDANELHQMLLYMGVATTENEVKEMIAQVDKNGDGDIDLDEFLMVMKTAQRAPDGGDAASPQTVRNASFNAVKNAGTQDRVRADQRRADEGAAEERGADEA